VAARTPPAPPGTDDDGDFLRSYDATRFERPSVTVDVVLLTILDGALKALVIKRANPPYKGRWALPGGFVGIDESLDDAARRKLDEEAGVRGIFLEQLYTFGEPRRDPRTRVISVAYYALASADRVRAVVPTAEATEARFVAVPEELGASSFAFDHKKILEVALERIRGKLEYAPIAYQLLPATFTLTELQQVYEIVLGHPLDKRNFRVRVLDGGQLEDAKDTRRGSHRPARLYRFVGP
jgi:8-oxo-dGTP diphosphatase